MSMMPLVAFPQSVVDAERRIDTASADTHSIRHALTWGCGLLEGYYRAGSVSKVEFEGGCMHLRAAANQRIALQELREQAVAEGLS